MDRLTRERRSWLMSRIGSQHTSTELRVRRTAHALGLRYSLHRRELAGSPDLVFRKYGVALFVHGCFWHRHAGCKRMTTPKTRREFWRLKFESNVARDQRVARELRARGWRVEVIWECETFDRDALEGIITQMFGIACRGRAR